MQPLPGQIDRPRLESTDDSPGINPHEIRHHVEKIAASRSFARSQRLQQFLRYIVGRLLQGKTDTLKEYHIGVDVFHRGDSFDPRIDPIVRVQAARLRLKLKEYSKNYADNDSLTIELPLGGYVPLIRPAKREDRASSTIEPLTEKLAILQSEDEEVQYSLHTFEQSRRKFWMVADEDQSYARALAQLSYSYIKAGCFHLLAPELFMPRAAVAAREALMLDSSIVLAHICVGISRLFHHWDWVAAHHAFMRALQLDPNEPAALVWHAHLLLLLGNANQALHLSRKAAELRPMDPEVQLNLALTLYFCQENEEALKLSQELVRVKPQFYWGHWMTHFLYDNQWATTEILQTIEDAQDISESNIGMFCWRIHLSAKVGMVDEAQKLLRELVCMSARSYVPPMRIAIIYAVLGDADQVFHWLEKAYTARDIYLVHLNAVPVFGWLRRDARFVDLTNRVGPSPEVCSISASHA